MNLTEMALPVRPGDKAIRGPFLVLQSVLQLVHKVEREEFADLSMLSVAEAPPDAPGPKEAPEG